MSKKVIVDAAGAATATTAVIADVFTTLASTDSALTGTLGLVQKAGLVVAGMAIQNNRLGRGWNPMSAS